MRQLSPIEKWSYAIGNIPYAVKDTAFGTFVVFYYTQVMGLSGTLTGLAMFIALSWDAISDPIVGSWSDSVRSRWGRRHPLMLLGAIPTALLFLLLFGPPLQLSETGLFFWLLAVSIALRTFLTVYFIPYQAMGAELSEDYDERTEIAKGRVTVAWLGGLMLPAIAYTLIFQAQGDTDGRLVNANYWTYGILSFTLAFVTGAVCLWGTRKAIPHLPQPRDSANRFSLRQTYSDFMTASRNRNFRATIGTKLAFGLAAGTYTTMGLYMGTYFFEFTSEQLAGLVVPMLFAALTAFAVLGRIGQAYDKPPLMALACLGFGINALWFVGGRLLGLLPENGSALLYALQMVNAYIAVFCVVCLQILGASLLADILDEQELDKGIRQEGVFFAASAFVLKATTGMGTLMGGIIVDFAGLKPNAEPGTVPGEVLATLGWFYGPGIATAGLVAWWCARRVQLSRQQHAAIREQLAQATG
jgi:GPH family glycoside/pentoside/hexuronide:cation symporter